MRIYRSSLWHLLSVAVLALAGMHGVATAETCSAFEWPVDAEISLMAAPEAEAVATGGTIASIPTKAIELRLEPSPTVKFPVAPGIKKQAIPQNSFSGWLTIASVQKPGLYQITLPNHAWIDVVQNDELVQSTAFSGDPNCKTVRKSVRFELGTGPATVQIGGVSENATKLIIREADGK
jgi:hypothetical protein